MYFKRKIKNQCNGAKILLHIDCMQIYLCKYSIRCSDFYELYLFNIYKIHRSVKIIIIQFKFFTVDRNTMLIFIQILKYVQLKH